MELSSAVCCRVQEGPKCVPRTARFEHNIKKKWCTIQPARCSSVAPLRQLECMEGLSAARAVLVHEHRWFCPVQSVLRSNRSHPYAQGRVECKEDPIACRAPIVLEHNIKKKRYK